MKAAPRTRRQRSRGHELASAPLARNGQYATLRTQSREHVPADDRHAGDGHSAGADGTHVDGCPARTRHANERHAERDYAADYWPSWPTDRRQLPDQ
jgi:hypothetical protein